MAIVTAEEIFATYDQLGEIEAQFDDVETEISESPPPRPLLRPCDCQILTL